MKLWSIVLLGCCLFVAIRSDTTDDYYYDEDEYNSETPNQAPEATYNYTHELPGVFQSECAYLPADVVKNKDCGEITLNFNAQVEVLLPVNVTEGNIIIVPFLVSQKQKVTTFSHEAAEKLGVEEDQNITVVYETIPTIIGDENILGLDILKRSLLGIDLFNYEAGIAILSDKGMGYLVNWPLDTFRDKKLQHRTKKFEAGFKKLVQKLEKAEVDFVKEMEKYRDQIAERDALIKEAKEEIEELLKTYKKTTGKEAIKPKRQTVTES